MTTQSNEGQTSFNTITIDDDAVEMEIAEQCFVIEENRIAASNFNKAVRRRKELLPVHSLEEPTEVTIKGGRKYGNWIIRMNPRETEPYSVEGGRAVGIKATQQ